MYTRKPTDAPIPHADLVVHFSKARIPVMHHARIEMSGVGIRPPPPHKAIWFLRLVLVRTPPPWKITKLPSQHSKLGHLWPANETPYHRPASERKHAFSCIRSSSPLIILRKEKNVRAGRTSDVPFAPDILTALANGMHKNDARPTH